MDSSASATVIESCISSETSQPSSNVQLLEISLISAQDLASISKSMQTYAVAWINPNKKRTTQTDAHGHKNPEWMEKFVFRLDKDQLEDVRLTTEIYTISWFRDVLVGTACVPISDLMEPLLQTAPSKAEKKHFITLQVRRPSGGPQGKLNVGVALLDSTMRSMPLKNYTDKINFPQQKSEDYEDDDHNKKLDDRVHLWRSMSTSSSDPNNKDFASKRGSVDQNGTVVNESAWDYGSEICSDIGPSASMVAGERAMKLLPPSEKAADADDTASSILEVMTIEEAKARGRYRVGTRERGRRGAGYDDDETSELSMSRRRSRRNSDGGLFSCVAYGIEFTIVCGASKKPISSNNRRNGSGRRKPSEINSA